MPTEAKAILIIFSLIIFSIVIFFTIKKIHKIKQSKNDYPKIEYIETEQKREVLPYNYKKRSFLTENEKFFMQELAKLLKPNFVIIPQIPLNTIVQKQGNFKYQNELFRIIDFAIFNKSFDYPKLLIELNDKTHLEKDRIDRDVKVKEICEKANIQLITITAGGNYKLKILSAIPKEFTQQAS